MVVEDYTRSDFLQMIKDLEETRGITPERDAEIEKQIIEYRKAIKRIREVK